MVLHWYKCLNEDCKSYNRNFTLVIGFAEYGVYAQSEQCPFCHCDNIERDTKREHDNRYKFEKTILELSK
jgi:hypothetical protein